MASASEMDEIPSPPKEKCDSDVSTNGNETESKIGNKRNKNMKNNQTKDTTSTDSKSVNRDKEEDQPQAHKKEESFNSDNENPDKKGSQPLVHETEGSDPINSDNPENTDGQPQSHEKEGSDPLSSEQMTNEEAEQLSQDGKYYETKTMDEKTKRVEDEVVRLSNENETLKTTTKSLENDIKDKDTDTETFKFKIQELSEQHKTLENDIKEREADIESYKSKIQKLSEQISQMNELIQEHELSIQNYKEECDDKTKKLQQSEDDAVRLRSEIDTLKANLKERIKEARTSIKNYKGDNEEKKEKLKQYEDEITMLREKNERLTLETKRANTQVEQLKRDLTKKVAEIENLIEASKMYKEDAGKQQKYCSELKEVLDDKLKTICSQQDEIEVLKRSISDCKKQTDKTLKDYEKRQKKLEKNLQKEKEEHKKDLDNKNKVMKKERDNHQQVVESLQTNNQRFQDEKRRLENEKNRLSPYEQAYHKIVHEVNSQQNIIESQRITIDRYQNENESKREKISTLEDEKETLLLRLSRITGAQLTYNNPNIADLSDDKRPTKLAEEFSELYDNEWTDAYECIDAENDSGKTKVLYDLLKKSYEFCEALSSDHDNAIRNSFSTLNYAKRLSEGTHDDMRSNTNNERQGTPTDELNENKNQALLGANEFRRPMNADAGGAMTADKSSGGKEKNGGSTNLSEQDIESEPQNDEESLNKMNRNQNKQLEKSSKEKGKVEGQQEKTGNEMETLRQQGTESGYREEVGTKNKDDNNMGKMYEKTNEENKTIEHTNPPKQGIESGLLGENGNLAEANKNQEDQQEKMRVEKETPRQQGTKSGFPEEVETTKNEDDNNTEEFGLPCEDGNLAKADMNQRDNEEESGEGKEIPRQQGIESGLQEEAEIKNTVDDNRKELHGITTEAKNTAEHGNPTHQSIKPGLPDEEVNLLKPYDMDKTVQPTKSTYIKEERDHADTQTKTDAKNTAEHGNPTHQNIKPGLPDEEVNLKPSDMNMTVQPTKSTYIKEERDHADTQTKTTENGIGYNNGASSKDDCTERRKYHVEIVKVSEVEFKFEDLTSEQKKTITDLRKVCEEKQTNDVVKEGSKLIAMEMRIEDEKVMKYISTCIGICWSMRRHTPPVYIDFPEKIEGLPLDTKLYRPYTKSGKLIHFVVWPVLYLHEGGPLLSKGVAQGQK